MAILYLVATPIGNLEDITLRALRILGEVQLIAAEDTRQTRKLLSHYQIHTDLVSYHEYNKQEQGRKLLEQLALGDIALVSDAGMPLLSDPGYELVHDVLEAGHEVRPIPGPSAPLAALVVSGLPADSFVFHGYLPRKEGERLRVLRETAQERSTILFFEVPHRLNAALENMESVYGSDRRAAVCRELTKKFEEVKRGTLADMRAFFAVHEPRGEFTIVLEGATEIRWNDEKLRHALADLLSAGMSRKQAARDLAEVSGWSRNQIYELSLEEK
ncbi:MAG: 16S rRNA (cytidine(1402)-2'-O)-methyltransferase [Anaerolineales bacterium]|nr:16S rRNA (cytidine(1402)-2'-O)-methyltransferase [Anaerolineales bacterium]